MKALKLTKNKRKRLIDQLGLQSQILIETHAILPELKALSTALRNAPYNAKYVAFQGVRFKVKNYLLMRGVMCPLTKSCLVAVLL